jgi:peroxiredoxin
MSTLEELIKAAENEWLAGWKSGPIRTRWTELPLQVDDPAPNIELLDSNGKPRQLKSFWENKPALVIFWRHYGCSCGMERAQSLRQEYDDYIESGANVVIIGQGEPQRAALYAEKYRLPPVPLLCDPEFKAYHAFGLLEGKESQILFDAPDELLDRELSAGLELARSRKKAKRPLVDNSWLLPGEFVVDRNGIVRLAYRYNYCEDFPDHRVLLAAIREAKKSLEYK